MFIYPYKMGSGSVKGLARSLPAKIIRREGSRFRGRAVKTVINWGCSGIENNEVLRCRVINWPEAVAVAADKLKFFRAMEGTNLTPPFCTALEDALAFIVHAGRTVVCRTILSGHSGAGIVLATKPEELVRAPLYVKYIKKAEEYRVHVFKDSVIDTQRKAKRNDVPEDAVNWQIRNHSNGFVYAREGLDQDGALPGVHAAALATVKELGLDFGAVDIIYNRHEGRPYVLEVNSAPGLEGTTLENYTKAFKDMI